MINSTMGGMDLIQLLSTKAESDDVRFLNDAKANKVDLDNCLSFMD